MLWRNLHFKRLQADFDSESKTESKKHAKKSFGVDLTKVADAFTGVTSAAPAYALA